MQTIVATLLVAAVYQPLPKWSPIHGWELRINWRVPSLAAISRFLLFAGPICFVLLTKVVMYSERAPLQNSQRLSLLPFWRRSRVCPAKPCSGRVHASYCESLRALLRECDEPSRYHVLWLQQAKIWQELARLAVVI